MATFLLMPFGSAGDVFPFIGLGRELHRRGHAVALATNERFGPAVERTGVEFVQHGTTAQFEEVLRNPDLWHPRRGLKAVIGNQFMAEALRKQCQLIQERLSKDRGLVVVAGTLCLGARVAREVMPIRLATVHLQPSVLFSVTDPPVFPGIALPGWLPRWIVRGFYGFANRFAIDPPIRAILEPFRESMGLSPTKAYLQHWIHSPDICLGLFPGWYGQARDWPANLRLTGFPLYDDRAEEPLPLEVVRFVDAGPKPVIITFGTGMVVGKRLFEAAIAACQQLKFRAILLTPSSEQIPSSLPESIKRFDYAPLRALLPHARAMIFHGGIGTSAQGLAAGVPLVCVPMAHDQPDNARRLEMLGVSVTVPVSRISDQNITAALAKVTGGETFASACRQVANRFVETEPLTAAAQHLEALVLH